MISIKGEKLITPSEAAQLLGMSKRTVIRWCANGSNQDQRPKDSPDLKPIRGPNRRLYFRENYIQDLVSKYFGTAFT